MQSALYAVLGRDMALGFTPVKGSGEDMSVSGFVSLPTCCRGTRGYQHFFVNGRYVKSRTMMAALEEAYANQKMVGKFPGCVLHLTTRLNAVDVNVHPTKQEVKFGSDKKVFDAVYYAVKSTLEADRTRPSLQVEPPPGGARSGGPHLPGDDPGGVPPDGGTARSAPAPPRLHRPPGHWGRPGSPCRERRLRRPHLHPPVRRGGHPYPPGRSRTCPRRERHLRPPNLRRAARANGRPCPPS